MPSRDPKITQAYLEYKKTAGDECPFCVLGEREIVADYPHFVILRALFPYEEWDEKHVQEHLMAVPKQHVANFSEMNVQEAMELLQIISLYENDGYSIYARAPKDVTRSIVHQHTHLLLLER